MSLEALGGLADRQPTYSFDKPNADHRLGELMLYIAERSKDDPTYGATKLNKLLWWADFLSYARDGKPITGSEYQKQPNGPVPVRLVPVRDALIQNGYARIDEVVYFSRGQDRLVPLRPSEGDLFTKDQLALVDELINRFDGKSASEISKESHGRAWRARRQKDLIPYESIFVSNSKPSPEAVKRTHELAELHGWERA